MARLAEQRLPAPFLYSVRDKITFIVRRQGVREVEAVARGVAPCKRICRNARRNLIGAFRPHRGILDSCRVGK